ncbi:MAG TPA: dTMP kinase [Candidatus Limnocylindrales bacterium]
MTTRPLPVPRGWFISLEGPEGSGKTSQAEALRARFAATGFNVTLTREPGGTPTGERIRAILLQHAAVGGATGEPTPRTDALLFNAARAQLVAEVIGPAIARGDVVLCARFADSTMAYQGHGAGLPPDALRTLERFATDGLRPDLTLLLDVPPEVGLARKSGDEVTRFEAGFDVAFHRRVRNGFLALAAAEPGRFAVIDATGAFAAVFDALVATIADRLPELAAVLARPRDAVGDEPPPIPLRIPR